MESRFTDIKPVQRCYSPVRVFRNGEFNYFPCGRCPACRLDKANDLSLRLANDLETFPFNIFFTLTYSNEYIPKCYLGNVDVDFFFYSNHFCNYRFNGVRNVRRQDNIFFYFNEDMQIPKIKNFPRSDVFAYSSKNDVILWLKLLKQSIYNEFKERKDFTRKSYGFRHFIISEYGPTTFRPHLHGIISTWNKEVAEYLLRFAMYQNWQMCDKALFDEYTHLCDSGAASYVTQYLNCFADIPKAIKFAGAFPFRLSSKSPSVGFSSFDPKEIFENIFAGVNEYSKTVSRCETKYVFPYPSEYMHRLFPKCREYSLLSYRRLRYIYGFLWRNVVVNGFSFDTCNRFIREKWFPADVTAAQKCYQYCLAYEDDFHVSLNPDIYLFLLDMYYYKESMFALCKFYEWQELHASESVSIMYSYQNFEYRVNKSARSSVEDNTLSFFLAGFGLTLAEVQTIHRSVYEFDDTKLFRKQVEDICSKMIKLPKFNEKFGFAPHII